ncbi:tetratricopeptide repeat protein [bacterium]|nr:tetratricopeptide repeat protein [bacterium]
MASQHESAASGHPASAVRAIGLVILLSVMLGVLLTWMAWPSPDRLNEARRLAARGDVAQACDHLRRLMNASPDDTSARLLLAKLLASIEPGEALNVLSRVQSDSAQYTQIASLFDQIVSQLERQGTAREVVEKISDENPDDLLLARTLARIAIRSGDSRTGERAAQRAVALAPDDPEALLLLADAFDGLGRRIDMIEPLERVLQHEPESYVAHANLAYALRHAARLSSALVHVRWCLDRKPEDVAVQILLGQILRDQGRWDEALAVARTVIATEPRNPDARVLEAELLIFRHDSAAALETLLALTDSQRQRHDVHELVERARRFAEGDGVQPSAAKSAIGPVSDAAGIRFVDVALDRGLDFQHLAPPTDQRHTHLVMGGGLGWLDFDRDGWPDLYFGQGRPFRSDHPLARDSASPELDRAANDRLYRNLNGLRFQDVTDRCGIWNPDYATGIAIGDWNNDGFDDVFTGCFGPNRFFVNLGDGTFVEQSEECGLDDAGFTASVTWFDANGDGNLDLFVTNYLDLDPYNYHLCHAVQNGREIPVTCHPLHVLPRLDSVYQNPGTEQFLNITRTGGFAAESPRQGLGIAAADFDLDGDCDVYVANDAVPNQLWVNDRGTFSEQAVASGVALNRAGEREAGMGVAVGDVTGDGLPDLFVTNYFSETNTLYRNEGHLLFMDVTDESGLGTPSRPRLGFGATLLDANNDGWLDLFVANGHVNDRLQELGQTGPFAQRALMFANVGRGRFEDISESAGSCFHQPFVGRGSAAADFDRDGRVDIAVQHLNGQSILLRNESVPAHPVLQLELVGTSSSRSAIGAIVMLECGDGRQMRMRNGSTSYLSCDDDSLAFAITPDGDHCQLTVRWPGSLIQQCQLAVTDGRAVIIEGQSGPAIVP